MQFPEIQIQWIVANVLPEIMALKIYLHFESYNNGIDRNVYPDQYPKQGNEDQRSFTVNSLPGFLLKLK
jgi:hypothetical protein